MVDYPKKFVVRELAKLSYVELSILKDALEADLRRVELAWELKEVEAQE